MGNQRHLLYLSIILLLQGMIFFPPMVESEGEKKAVAPLTVPCEKHTVCWLYCEAFYGNNNLGTGCCFEKKFKDTTTKKLETLQGLEKACYCCFGLALVSTIPVVTGKIDEYCDKINKPLNDASGTTSVLESLLCKAKVDLQVKCEIVQVETTLKLFDVLGDSCDKDAAGNVVVGTLTDVIVGIIG